MENTQRITTVHAADISPAEIYEVREHLDMLVDDKLVEEDSILLEALYFILDTLEAGKDTTIFTRLSPEDYTLA